MENGIVNNVLYNRSQKHGPGKSTGSGHRKGVIPGQLKVLKMIKSLEKTMSQTTTELGGGK